LISPANHFLIPDHTPFGKTFLFIGKGISQFLTLLQGQALLVLKKISTCSYGIGSIFFKNLASAKPLPFVASKQKHTPTAL
jgi:hypothetical protein